jgi:hypothetical protein
VPLAIPISPREHRNRRLKSVRHKAVSLREMRRALERDAAELTAEDFQLLDDHRPRRRGDCRDNGLRPCPFVGCRHHLFLDGVDAAGALVVAHPDVEPWELDHTCALDLVEGRIDGLPLGKCRKQLGDDGPASSFTLEIAAPLLNLTRERVRQVEIETLAELAALRALPRPEGLDPEADEVDYGEEKGVSDLANLQVIMNATGATGIVVHAPWKTEGPQVNLRCSSCGKTDSFWFQGLGTAEVRLLAVLACMRLSSCCQKPITARLEELPAKMHRRRLDREAALERRIVEALREAGAAGMSQRQLRRAVRGDAALIGQVAKRLAASSKSPVRRTALVRGGPERFFCTVPEPVKPAAT